MTAKEAAEFLGVNRKYIYQLTHRHKVPYYAPTGGRILFKRSELMSLVENAKVTSMAELQTKAQTSMIREGGIL